MRLAQIVDARLNDLSVANLIGAGTEGARRPPGSMNRANRNSALFRDPGAATNYDFFPINRKRVPLQRSSDIPTGPTRPAAQLLERSSAFLWAVPDPAALA